MGNFKRAIAFVFVLILAAAVLFFVLENQQPVSLLLFGWSSPMIPVAVLMLTALVVGLVVGPLLGGYVAIRAKRKLR